MSKQPENPTFAEIKSVFISNQFKIRDEEIYALKDENARLKAENAKLQKAIEDWWKEEALWKEREAELLADSKRLERYLAIGDFCNTREKFDELMSKLEEQNHE